jgi:hypothetical protein
MTHAEITFAIIVGVISAIGLVWGSWLTARATRKAAEESTNVANRQIVLNSKSKIAEFRQAWINNLRDAMAKLMAFRLKEPVEPEVIEATAKIQLLMNKKDSRYPQLLRYMKEYVVAMKAGNEQYDSSEFLALCQDILKNEWEVLKKELLELDSSIR